MIRLLNAGFNRLRKSKAFWAVAIFSIGLALFMIYTQYSDMIKYGEIIEVDQLMLNYATIIGIVIAIFTSLFLGVEYSDGAIRNKISIGHERKNIYLSNLVITTISSWFFYILFMVAIAIVGIPIFGGITIPISNLLMLTGCIFVMILSFSSIFTFIAMLISNKTITAILTIMLAFGMMMVAMVCFRVLEAQEYIQSAALVDGEMKLEEVPNPKYPSETKKKVCQILLDINPTGQGFQIAGRAAPNIQVLPLYSLGILILFTGSGVVLFKRKELK